MTPFHWASKKNFVKLVKLLIEKGADFEEKDS